jgi:hypothetical protein
MLKAMRLGACVRTALLERYGSPAANTAGVCIETRAIEKNGLRSEGHCGVRAISHAAAWVATK